MLAIGDRNRHAPQGARSTGDEGFALPGVLLAMVLLGAIAVASLMTTGHDRMTGRALRESAKAFYAAEAGAEAIIAGWEQAGYTMLLTGPGDSLDLGWRTLENGWSYWAMLRRVDGGGSARRLYTVNVTGRGLGSLGGQRVVTVVMRTRSLLLNVQAPMMSIGGMTKSGSAGIFSGYDVATADSCPEGGQPPVAGAFTPDSSLWEGDPLPENVIDDSTWLEGDPAWLQGGTPAEVAEALGIDWAGILAMTPDLVINSIADWPSSAYFDADPKPWPVILVEPGVDLNGVSGQGLIVAPQGLRLGGGFTWDGMILVGDAFLSHGNTIINGGIFSGLNVTLGQPVGQSDLGSGTKTFLYHSCNLLKASRAATAKGAGTVEPLDRGGWWQVMD